MSLNKIIKAAQAAKRRAETEQQKRKLRIGKFYNILGTRGKLIRVNSGRFEVGKPILTRYIFLDDAFNEFETCNRRYIKAL